MLGVGGWIISFKRDLFSFFQSTSRPKKIWSFKTCFTFICCFTFKFLVRQPQVPLRYDEQVCKYGKPEFEKRLSLQLPAFLWYINIWVPKIKQKPLNQPGGVIMFPRFNLKSLDVFLHYYQMPPAVWNEVINSFECSTWTYPLSFESLYFTYLHSEGIVLNYSGVRINPRCSVHLNLIMVTLQTSM